MIGSGTTTGVRESRRVMGDYVIDADEMAEGCRFADVVVHKALFIVDIHNPDGEMCIRDRDLFMAIAK